MHIDQFLDYLALEKRYSHNTIKSYKIDLEQLCVFLEENYPELVIDQIESKHLRAWIQFIAENATNRTISRKISSLKSYFKYLYKKEMIFSNPGLRLISPKKEKKLPEFVRKEVLNKYLDEFPTKEDFQSYRDRLIIELLYSTGIRLDELVTLTNDRIDLDSKYIRVIGKRNKERQIPITNRILPHFNNYERERRGLLKEKTEKKYFLTKKEQPIYHKLVYRIVKKFLVSITGDTKMSTHTLRHTFATHMLNNGADIYAIKELLGHSNLSATEIYTHNSYEQLLKVYKQAHPRA